MARHFTTVNSNYAANLLFMLWILPVHNGGKKKSYFHLTTENSWKRFYTDCVAKKEIQTVSQQIMESQSGPRGSGPYGYPLQISATL